MLLPSISPRSSPLVPVPSSIIIIHLFLSCPWWCHPLRLPSPLPSPPPQDRTTPLPYRRPPRLPSHIVSSFGCPFLLLKSHLGRGGGGGGGGGGGTWSSSSSSFSSPAPARRPNPSFTPTSWPSSYQRFRRRPLAPRHRRYLLLNLASRHDKRWLGCRQHIEAYGKLPSHTTSATSPPTWPASPPLRPSTRFFKRQQNFATGCLRTDPSLSSGILVPVFR